MYCKHWLKKNGSKGSDRELMWKYWVKLILAGTLTSRLSRRAWFARMLFSSPIAHCWEVCQRNDNQHHDPLFMLCRSMYYTYAFDIGLHFMLMHLVLSKMLFRSISWADFSRLNCIRLSNSSSFIWQKKIVLKYFFLYVLLLPPW
jgi:hypothetical protein